MNALFIGKQAGLLAMRFPGAELGYSKFLDVYGEPVVLPDSLTVFGQGTSVNVSEQLSQVSYYSSFVPMGLDQVDYYGNKASVFGYKNVGGARIGFLGANLTKIAVLSGDNSALKFIQKIFDLPLDFEPGNFVPLTNFQIISNGYEMGYRSEHALTAIVPVANLKGTKVFLDGMPISNEEFEDLIQLELPAGSHYLKIAYPSSIFKVQDIGISLLALVLVIILYSVNVKMSLLGKKKGV